MRGSDLWNEPVELEKWTNATLDYRGMQGDDLPLPQATPAQQRRHLLALNISHAKSEARRGRPEQLRELFPDLAEFIHSPSLERGQRYSPQFDPYGTYALELALDDVCKIRQIWREHFGKSYAPRGGPSALKIAAERNKVTETQLLNFRKNRHRHR